MYAFLCGIFVGVMLVLVVAYIYFFSPFAPNLPNTLFADQFQPIRLPPVLRSFLKSAKGNAVASKWESCFTLSLILHFLYQEHKDTRRFRRWFHKRLQLELNDLMTRSAAGRLIQDIRVRDLSMGSQFPILKGALVESYRMSEDNESFETLNMLVDVDYTGGFQASVDVSMLFGRFAQLSVKLSHLSGKARLTLTREPFTHWTVAFIEMPLLDFKVESQWQGRQVKHIIPLITQQFRRIIQRKHVLPNYKIRYRPFFTNPHLMPSPPIDAFDHIETVGGLEVTVLQCTRLNTSLAAVDHNEVYCTLTLEKRPFLNSAKANSVHCVTVLLNFVRHALAEPIGLTFKRSVVELGLRAVQIDSVDAGSAAEKCGFLPDDIILAVNNVPIQNERQAHRLLCGTAGELNVLVERSLNESNGTSSTIAVDPEDVVIQNSIYDEGYLMIGGAAEMRSTLKSVDDGQLSTFEHMKTPVIRRRSHSTSRLVDGTMKREFDVEEEKFAEVKSNIGSLPATLSAHMNADSQQDSVDTVEAKCNIRKVRSEAELVRPQTSSQSHIKPMIIETLVATPVQECVPTSAISLETADNIVRGDPPNMSDAVSTSGMLSRMSASSTVDLNTVEEPPAHGADVTLHDKERPTSRRQRIQARAAEVHARAAEMAAAGRARVSGLWYRRKESPSNVELAAEAIPGELLTDSQSPSPSSSPSLQRKKSRNESQMKAIISSHSKRKRKESAEEGDKEKSTEQGASNNIVHSRSTKSLALNENILWGQSLHFALEDKTSKYLNVSVHSRCTRKNISHDGESNSATTDEPTKPIMLGYVCIPVAQILDDCQLTLSNCHREIFTLRAPMNAVTRRPMCDAVQEACRHAGFDARLCYGDILLGFRYFRSGLPDGVALNQQLDHSSEEEEEEDSLSTTAVDAVDENETKESDVLPSQPQNHHFTAIFLRSGSICAVCKGKVWLKSALRCVRCQLICHHKCVTKLVDPLIVCTPNQHFDDINFEILDDTVLANPDVPVPSFLDDTVGHNEIVEQLTSPSSSHNIEETSADDDHTSLTRRRRIANRVSEKWSSTWSRMSRRRTPSEIKPTAEGSSVPSGARNDPLPCSIVSVESAIPDVFAALGINGDLCQMRYQPGNAYNEEMINAAKNVGKEIFAEMDPEKRKAKINEQMDQIQRMINKTTVERLNAMEASKTCDEKSVEFAELDRRLQALAVLMLHYCAALQNCVDREEELKRLHEEEKASSGEAEEEKTLIVFDEQREPKNNEETYEANKDSSDETYRDTYNKDSQLPSPAIL
uniref:PDZ domain-containing protein 8 n=1 Tax=Ascaris suum TaxID=6253 RepID=F1KQD4_ASCSU